MPIFAAFFRMALERKLGDTVTIQSHHQDAIGLAFYGSALLYILCPYFVLRRHLRRYGLGLHIACLLGIVMGCALFLAFATNVSGVFYWLGGRGDFSAVLRAAAFDSNFALSEMLGWPWHRVLLEIAIYNGVLLGVPLLLLCAVDRRMASGLTIYLYLVLAGFLASVSYTLFEIVLPGYANLDYLNVRPWSQRIAIIAIWVMTHMIWASVSAIGLGLLVYRRDANGRDIHVPHKRIAAQGWPLALITMGLVWGIGLPFFHVFGDAFF